MIHVNTDLFLVIVQAWFRSLPALAYMRVEIDFIETRWKRKCTDSGTSGHSRDPRSIVVPYDKRRKDVPILEAEYEDTLFSVKDDETYSLTVQYDARRWSQKFIDRLRSIELEEFRL
ncbi:hypothetical protein DENSPDRAFT_840244 [Dentipellis sp. KUC8613]|nr:hypothetical protein DENSPDRAFT_840244 [Dentipellis sp. KUC8613]